MKRKRGRSEQQTATKQPEAELNELIVSAFRLRREARRRSKTASIELARKLGIQQTMGNVVLDVLEHASQRGLDFGWLRWLSKYGLNRKALIAAARCGKWIGSTSITFALMVCICLGCTDNGVTGPPPPPCGRTCDGDQPRVILETHTYCCNRGAL